MTKLTDPQLERLVLTIAEGGAVLGMAESTTRQAIREGTWPCPCALVKVAGRTKVSLPRLQRWLAGEISADGSLVAPSSSPSTAGTTSPVRPPAHNPPHRRGEGTAPPKQLAT